MNYDFNGQVALVTGGAMGMGLAAAKAYAAAGASVAILDVDQDSAQKVADDLNAKGHKVVAVSCNVADEDEVETAVNKVVDKFGRLDFAFNNAGVQADAVNTAEATGAEYDRIHGINMRGVWNCMKYELIHMKGQKSGSIINNSSIGGIVGLPGRSIYHATKHAVIGMTKSSALEYADQGIRINAVCPGVIETPMVKEMLENEPSLMDKYLEMQPIGRLGQPEEIAEAVMWLSSPASSFVLGHALVLDGGFTVS